MEIDVHIADYRLKNTVKNDLHLIQKKSKSSVPALLALFFFTIAFLGLKISSTAYQKEFHMVLVIFLVLASSIFALMGIVVILASYVLTQRLEFRKDEFTFLSFFGFKKTIPRSAVQSMELVKEMIYNENGLSDVLMHINLILDRKVKEFPIASISKKNSVSDMVNSASAGNVGEIEAEAGQLATIIAQHWHLHVKEKTINKKYE